MRGALGQPMTDVVNIGIGGSDLGPAMATRALGALRAAAIAQPFRLQRRRRRHRRHAARARSVAHPVHRLVEDLHHAGDDDQRGDRARLDRARRSGEAAVGDHFAAVSTNSTRWREFGIEATRVFGFWDWVGGRYSIWSSIGLPLAIAIGPERFDEFLRGGYEVDEHFRERADRAEHPDADGAAQRLEPQRPRLRDAGGDPLRPAARALSRLSPAIADGEQRQVRAARRLAGQYGDRARSSGASPAPTASTPSSSSSTRARRSSRSISCVAATPTDADAHHHDLLVANCLAQGAGADARAHAGGGRGAARKQGASEAEAARLAPHKSFSGSRPTSTFLYRRTRPAHARPPDRALRAQGVRRRRRSGTSTRSTNGASNSARSWPRASRRSSPTPPRARRRSTPRPRGWSRICARCAARLRQAKALRRIGRRDRKRLGRTRQERRALRASPSHAARSRRSSSTRRQGLAHPRVIGVEPGDLVGVQQLRLDEAEVDRREGDRLEAEHRPFGAGDCPLLDHEQVLDADAEAPGRIIAGLVGNDHAREQRRRSGLGDALRAFVDREIDADAVAGAMVEIEAGAPQRGAREARRSARRSFPAGKTARATAMWPFSTRVKRSRMCGVGRPTAIVRVMSVVPSSYWAPLSMRKMPRSIFRLDVFADPIMRNAPNSGRRRRWSGTKGP